MGGENSMCYGHGFHNQILPLDDDLIARRSQEKSPNSTQRLSKDVVDEHQNRTGNNSNESQRMNQSTPERLEVIESPDGQISSVELFSALTEISRNNAYIYDHLYLLLVDVRSRAQYDEHHVMTAVHILGLVTPLIRAKLPYFHRIVLYSDSDGRKQLAMAIDLLRESQHEIEILNSSYDDFHERFPFVCTSEIVDSRIDIPVFPSLILEDWLFQGTGVQATDIIMMSVMGITHIVNITTEHPSDIQTIKYLNLKLSDETTSQLIHHLKKIVEFVEDAHQQKGKVLIHCNMGVSRSSTATIAYLMHSRKCSLGDAFKFLRSRRSVCSPNRGFLMQLEDYEEIIFGERYTDAEKLWLSL